MNKPKIDLKARLGRKAGARSASAGVPLPVSAQQPGGQPVANPYAMPQQGQHPVVQRPGSVPARAPSVLPQQPSQGANIRPSGLPSARPAQPQARTTPVIDPSDPYSSMPSRSAPGASRAQSMAFDLNDDIGTAARKSGKKSVILGAGIAAAVSLIIGYAVGGASARSDGANAAVEGAKALVVEVELASKKVEELDALLGATKTKLDAGVYPKEEVSKLGAMRIPFDGSKLTNKGMGRFKPALASLLVTYAGAATAANEQTERVQRLLANEKKVKGFLDTNKNPKFNWSLRMVETPKGAVASMLRLGKPFSAAGDWPEKLSVVSRRKSVKLERYKGGNPFNKKNKASAIVVDPRSESAVCSVEYSGRIKSAVNQLLKALHGDKVKGGGLMSDGKSVVAQLKKIGGSEEG